MSESTNGRPPADVIDRLPVPVPAGALSDTAPAPARERPLAESHRRMLKDSAIGAEVIAARGYYTATLPAELERLGFAASQRRVPALVIPIRDVNGRVALHQSRPDDPRIDGKGKPRKYETPFGHKLVLDVPPGAHGSLSDPAEPLWITEGSKKVDAATSIGLCCIGVVGVDGWHRREPKDGGPCLPFPDWERIALRGRKVYVAYDSDVMVKLAVKHALGSLHAFLSEQGAEIRLVYLPASADGEKVGLDDFLAAGNGERELLELSTGELACDSGGNGNGPSQTERLVELALQGDAELFHTPEREPWATVPVGEYRETMPLASVDFSMWLDRLAYEGGHSASEQAIRDATRRLSSRARYDGAEHEVSVRVAGKDGAIYLDLADERRRVVEITARGWQVLAGEAPVKFRRAGGMRPLPEPARGGSIEALRPFVNVDDEGSWRLLIGWLAGCLNPSGPYPLLVLHGEQGSAKSTATRLLRSLIDPAMPDLRAEPENARDLMIAANNAHVLAFDNLSTLSTPRGWLSDALCRLATGGGYAVRALYSNSEEILFEATRPVILNGIEELPQRADLLSRSLLVELPRIEEENVQTESELLRSFDAARPQILGGLLDAAAAALANRATVRLPRLPRMADFAVWATAAEHALGWEPGAFMAAYDSSRLDAANIALEASPLWPALERCADGEARTYSDLLALLEEHAGEQATRQKGWPKGPRILSGMLKRLAPELRKGGIDIERGTVGSKGSRRKTITLRKFPESIDPCDPRDPRQRQSQVGESPGVAEREGGSLDSDGASRRGSLGVADRSRQNPNVSGEGVARVAGVDDSSKKENEETEQEQRLVAFVANTGEGRAPQPSPPPAIDAEAEAASPDHKTEAEREAPDVGGTR